MASTVNAVNHSEPITKVLTSRVTTVQRSEPLSSVYRLLADAPFHHVPVVDNDQVVGMISSIDVLRLAYDVDGSDAKSMSAMLDYQYSIDDAMTPEVKTLDTSATVADAAEMLSSGNFHSVVVLDDQDRSLAGIVTTTDLIRYLRDL